MKKDYEYKAALKKQYSIVLFSLVLICVAGWYFYPLDTNQKAWGFSIYIFMLGAATLWYLRRASISVLCNACQTNIFPFIELSKTVNKELKYCPICGEEIEI